MQQPSDPGDRFAGVSERNTADSLLRTAQQHHVALSGMADTKASILITVSSIVLTLAIGKLGDQSLRLPLAMLVVFTLVALFLAILAVLPGYRRALPDEGRLPPGFNLFFFGHFHALPRARYLDEVAAVLRTPGGPYAAWANDIYSLGCYLAHRKYRYLRYSYLFFLTGFVLATLTQGLRLLLG